MPPIQHRNVLALPRGKGNVFLSWRMLPTDAPDTPFFVERMVKGTYRHDRSQLGSGYYIYLSPPITTL